MDLGIKSYFESSNEIVIFSQKKKQKQKRKDGLSFPAQWYDLEIPLSSESCNISTTVPLTAGRICFLKSCSKSIPY